MALPKLSNINKKIEIDPQYRVRLLDNSIADIRELSEGDEYYRNETMYRIYQGKERRIGKGARVIKSIPKSTYSTTDTDGNVIPDLVIDDIEDDNLHQEIKKYFD